MMRCQFRLSLLWMFAALVFCTHCGDAAVLDHEYTQREYTQRLSIIKIIPFDERSQEYQSITESPTVNDFKQHIKTTLIRTVVRIVPWIQVCQDKQDALISLDVSHISSDTVDGLVSCLIDQMIAEITYLRTVQLPSQSSGSAHLAASDVDLSNVAINVLPAPGYPVPDPILLFNACRVDMGRFMAKNNSGDIEDWGFRRYLRNPKRKATDLDDYRFSEFNYGRAFIYPKLDDFRRLGVSHPTALATDQHRVITEAMSTYANENYEGENTLLVTIYVRSGETLLHRLTCGTFVSGTGQPLCQPVKDIFGGTNSVKLSLIKKNWEAISSFTSGIMPQKVDDLTTLKCYDKKPFVYEASKRRFPPMNTTSNDIRLHVKEILGAWDEPVSNKTLPSEITSKVEILYGESPVSERLDIYGENDLKGVLRGDFGTCFHQSELHFISMLDSKKLTELVDHFHVERYINSLVDPDVQNVADNIVVCCYNRKDTCRYCRSTFSHMLRTKLINQKLCSFVNGRFATNIFARAYDEIPVEFYAFAKETTEL